MIEGLLESFVLHFDANKALITFGKCAMEVNFTVDSVCLPRLYQMNDFVYANDWC